MDGSPVSCRSAYQLLRSFQESTAHCSSVSQMVAEADRGRGQQFTGSRMANCLPTERGLVVSTAIDAGGEVGMAAADGFDSGNGDAAEVEAVVAVSSRPQHRFPAQQRRGADRVRGSVATHAGEAQCKDSAR